MSSLHLPAYYNIANELKKIVLKGPTLQSPAHSEGSPTCHAIYSRTLVYCMGQTTEKGSCDFIIMCEIKLYLL